MKSTEQYELIIVLVNCSKFTSLTLSNVGDGDCSHIGYKVARPGAFEIASVKFAIFNDEIK